MDAATVERQVADTIRRCHLGLDATRLRVEVLDRVRRIVPVDAAFFATVDPVTLLFTAAVAEDPLASMTPLFLDNEFGRTDVNKFASLALAAEPVTSLDQATRGDRAGSPRYREIMAPLGLGDELRAALVAGDRCWGVLCLHRADSAFGFSEREVRLVRRIAPHLAEGLRRAVAIPSLADGGPEPDSPGLIMLDENLAVVSSSPAAEHWCAEIADLGAPRTGELPVAVHAVAARLAQLPAPATTPSIRVRTRGGRWLTVRAVHLDGPGGPQIGVIVESASPAQLSSLFLTAHGLTPAQTRVAALVLRGRSTRQIVDELHISANTVQEHLTAVFDKVGVRSRRELAVTLLSAAH